MAKYFIRLREPAPEINYLTHCTKRIPKFTAKLFPEDGPSRAKPFRSIKDAKRYITRNVIADMRAGLMVTTMAEEQACQNGARRARQRFQPVSHDLPMSEFLKLIRRAYPGGRIDAKRI